MKLPRKNFLTVAQQYFALKHNRLSKSGTGIVKRGTLVWRQTVIPTPLSRSYQIRFVYSVPGSPQVYVDQPQLKELAGDRKIPHVYCQDPVKLCLYLPKSGQWNRDKFIVDTILPWAILWLYYFEIWLACDEWFGGGEHPESAEEIKENEEN